MTKAGTQRHQSSASPHFSGGMKHVYLKRCPLDAGLHRRADVRGEHFRDRREGTLPSHPYTQITYVVSGRFSFTIDGKTREMAAGDTLLKKNSILHGCTCLEAGVLLDFSILCGRIFFRNSNGRLILNVLRTASAFSSCTTISLPFKI